MRNYHKGYILLLITVAFFQDLKAQIDTLKCKRGRFDFGIEIQGYPAGIIPTLTADLYFRNQLAVRLRAGGNFANRQDWSPYNDRETAKGYGGSLGLVSYHPYKLGHFTAGATIDIWSMWTHWKDKIDGSDPQEGDTYTLVFQPWINVGYLFNIRNTRINLGTTLGMGREFNIVTKGDRVGEGWMNSITLTVKYTLKR
ncbi:MAG: hypothetical protein H6605_06220 [Flavobacteriales bacterium]|nr:hypothetical protein [Flavobacteriales bacterium]